MPIYFWWGGKLLREGVVERGKGLGARRVGEGGGARSGVRGARGWNLYLNEVLNKTGIVSRLGCRNECYDMKSYEIRESPIFEGFPHCNDITFSKTRHNLAKKSPKTRRREIQLIIYARRSSHLENLNMWAHFKFLNSNISVFGHDFKPKMEISTDFSVIWRWYKRLVTAFSSFWVKSGVMWVQGPWVQFEIWRNISFCSISMGPKYIYISRNKEI